MPDTKRRITYRVAGGTAVRVCEKCPQLIAFVRTEQGAFMPVNVDEANVWRTFDAAGFPAEVLAVNVLADFDGESHYATCPNAREFRKATK